MAYEYHVKIATTELPSGSDQSAFAAYSSLRLVRKLTGASYYYVNVRVWDTVSSSYIDPADDSDNFDLVFYSVSSLTDTNVSGDPVLYSGHTGCQFFQYRGLTAGGFPIRFNHGHLGSFSGAKYIRVVATQTNTSPSQPITMPAGASLNFIMADSYAASWSSPPTYLVGGNRQQTYTTIPVFSLTPSPPISCSGITGVSATLRLTSSPTVTPILCKNVETDMSPSPSGTSSAVTWTPSTPEIGNWPTTAAKWTGTVATTGVDLGSTLSAETSTFPVCGYMVSSTASGHRLQLERNGFYGVRISAGSASPPTESVGLRSVELLRLTDTTRTTNSMADDGLRVSFPMNPTTGESGMGYVRSFRMRPILTSWANGVRIKVDVSTDHGSTWTNKINYPITATESGTSLHLDIGSMTACTDFRVYLHDNGGATTVQWAHMAPIGLWPGAPIELINPTSGQPFSSTELIALPLAGDVLSGAADVTQQLLIRNYTTSSFQMEIINSGLIFPISTPTTPVPVKTDHLIARNSSNVVTSIITSIAPLTDTPFNVRYTLDSADNTEDGQKVGRLASRIVRSSDSDARIYIANSSTNDIQEHRLNTGALVQTYVQGSRTPTSVCVDPFTGLLYMLESSSGTTITISTWDQDNLTAPRQTLTYTDGTLPADTWTSIAYCSGMLYVGGSGNFDKLAVLDSRRNIVHGQITLDSTKTAGTKFLCASHRGHLFVHLGNASTRFQQFDLHTGSSLRVINHGVNECRGFHIDYRPSNTEVVAFLHDGASTVHIRRYDAEDGTTISTTSFSGAYHHPLGCSTADEWMYTASNIRKCARGTYANFTDTAWSPPGLIVGTTAFWR